MNDKEKKKLFEDYKEAKTILYYLKPNTDKYYKMSLAMEIERKI